MHPRAHEHGFSLIEVLVSLFVLAIGVTGAAAMQLTALRTAQQSAYHTAAVQLATEMADTMRANYVLNRAAGGDEKDNPYLQLDYWSDPSGESAAGRGTTAEPDESMERCFAHACEAEAWARSDIARWTARLAQTLPEARVRICRDHTPWNRATNAYSWDCTHGAATIAAPVVIKIGWRLKTSDANRSAGSGEDAAGAEFPPRLVVAVVAGTS
jgi:type IV pilus assembly protein PilV